MMGAQMETRTLGPSAIEVSVVGLGCNNFGMKIDLAESRAVIDAALAAGITCFDTADMYGDGQSEEFLGQVLGSRRNQVVLATKFGGHAMLYNTGEHWGRREHVFASIDASLKKLRTDWIDLYQVHFPDPNTPIGETMDALDTLVKQGKVRAIGHSNFSREQIHAAAEYATQSGSTAFVTGQNEWSLLKREVESEVVPACEIHQLSVLPFFPLASGLLTGKYTRGETFPAGSRMAELEFAQAVANDENFTKVEALAKFAERKGSSLLSLAMSWLAQQPCVASVIAGATSPDQIRSNVSSISLELSSGDLAEIDSLTWAPA
jgi:aryl-alcohol dehydrogenase-like predicted oxidoreductase